MPVALPPAARRTALLGLGILAVVLVAGVPALGQELEPSGEITDAECYGHHKEAGFRSMDLFPTVIEEVPKGQPFAFTMAIRNPWLHELRGVYAYVNVSGAPGLTFPGGETPPTLVEPPPGAFDPHPSVSPDDYLEAAIEIPVEANATEMLVSLDGVPSSLVTPPRLGGLRNDYDLVVVAPDGTQFAAGGDPPTDDIESPPATSESLRLPYANLTASGPGAWRALVRFRGPEPGSYTLTAAVYYNLSKSTELRLPVADKLAPGESKTVEFTIIAKDVEALQRLRYGGVALAYHDHSDRNTEDEGNYDKWNTFEMRTGSELRLQNIQITETSIDTFSPIARRWAQVLGFVGSFLLVPSLVFGGTFGKASVNGLNRLLGGARRRVLFHNSLSFWLLGTSVLHLFLLLYESNYGWSHGLVWGGLALACMIGLGVTGATQRAFVARWGFTRWRFVHFAMGVLVLVFVLVHMTVDGTHLSPVRDAFLDAGGGTGGVTPLSAPQG